jgi:ABC-type nitrate/sulfonate/bicarbonate transport system substrate-binding protein
MIPTPSSLAAQLGYLQAEAARMGEPSVRIEFGDYDHRDDLYWMRHAANSKALFARSRGSDAHAVALSPCESGERIFVRADSDIRTPADLKGRRIALPLIANRLFDMDRQVYLKPYLTALRRAGLTLGDVNIVDTSFERPRLRDAPPEPRNFFEVAGETFLSQLRCGEVDAVSTIVRPSDAGDLREIYASIKDEAPIARGELRALLVSGPLLREHRDVVVGFVKCLLRAGEWAAAHSDEVLRLVARDIDLSEDALKRREIDLAGWSRVSCSQSDRQLMEHRVRFLRSEGIIDSPVVLDKWIDTTVMADAQRALATENAEAHRP